MAWQQKGTAMPDEVVNLTRELWVSVALAVVGIRGLGILAGWPLDGG